MVKSGVRAKRSAQSKKDQEAKAKPALAFLFDLDGTLVDSTYQHAFAWQQALEKVGIELAAWRIHRRMGMSGGLFLSALAREIGRKISRAEAARLARLHDEVYARLASKVHPLPGARQLLGVLTRARVPWAIATSGRMMSARPMLAILHTAKDVIVITRDHVERAKPDPDLFLAAAARLQTAISDCVVVGDSVWDMLAAQRARALGVGLLSGGFGQDELERAGAYRVYQDPRDLLAHLDEVGLRSPND
jgi:HAD superfamily hydrolase (TIGR01509 family)